MKKLIAVAATVGLVAVGGAAMALNEDSGEIRACWDAQGRFTNRHVAVINTFCGGTFEGPGDHRENPDPRAA